MALKQPVGDFVERLGDDFPQRIRCGLIEAPRATP
jgi:hypothetical protein